MQIGLTTVTSCDTLRNMKKTITLTLVKPLHEYTASEWLRVRHEAVRAYYKRELKTTSKRQLALRLGISRAAIIKVVNTEE